LKETLAMQTTPTIQTLCSESEIDAVADSWNKLQRHANVDRDFYRLGSSFRSEVLSPCVFALRDHGEVRALWAGRIENVRLPLRLGYVRLRTLSVKRLTIVDGGLIGDDSEETSKALLKHAVRFLTERRLDQLFFGYVPCSHTVFPLAAYGLKPWYCRDLGLTRGPHWTLTLPGTYEELLSRHSKKHRYWLKRLPTVLEKAFPGQWTMRSFTDEATVGDFCRDAKSVSLKSWQNEIGLGAFVGDAEEVAKCKLRAQQGAFRGYILYIGTQPSAFWMATSFQNTLHLDRTGYCAEYRKFEVGTVLLIRLLADHCGTGIRLVDFGHGTAAYKERFGDAAYDEASVRVYRHSLRGILANLVTGVNERGHQSIKRLLVRIGLLDRVRTLWKRTLGR
jgi:hypothetical protein